MTPRSKAAKEVDQIADLRYLASKVKEAVACDDIEAAHSMENNLHVKALKAILRGHPSPKKLARIALSTQSLKFSRHTS